MHKHKRKHPKNVEFPKLQLPSWPRERKKGPNILVLDTCSLVMLATPIPEQFFDPCFPVEKRPKTYLDLLHLLPKSVVSEIHLPDIVVEEFIGWNCTVEKSTGKTVSWQIDPHIEKNKAGYQTGKAFLEKALKGTDPFVKIVHSEKAEEYMGKIAYLIAQIEVVAPPKEFGYEPFDHKEYNKRLKGMLEFKYGEGYNLGETRCVEHALSHAISQDASVAMVTEDRWGQGLFKTALAQHPHGQEMDAWLLNARGLLLGLKTSGIMESVGILNSISTKDHAKYIASYAPQDLGHRPQPLVEVAGNSHKKMLNSFVERVRRSAEVGPFIS